MTPEWERDAWEAECGRWRNNPPPEMTEEEYARFYDALVAARGAPRLCARLMHRRGFHTRQEAIGSRWTGRASSRSGIPDRSASRTGRCHSSSRIGGISAPPSPLHQRRLTTRSTGNRPTRTNKSRDTRRRNSRPSRGRQIHG